MYWYKDNNGNWWMILKKPDGTYSMRQWPQEVKDYWDQFPKGKDF